MLYTDIGIHYKYFKSVSQFPFISSLKGAFICSGELTQSLM